MEARHIKFEYEEALNAKKKLLSSELNILQTAKHIRNYRLLRKKEIILKNKLNISLKNLKAKLNLIQLTFPKQETSTNTEKKLKKREIKQDQDIKNQLKEIQEKLAKLQ